MKRQHSFEVYHVLGRQENKIIHQGINIVIDEDVLEIWCKQIFRFKPRLIPLKIHEKGYWTAQEKQECRIIK